LLQYVDGDVELWVVSGSGWKIPVHALPAEVSSAPFWHIRPALSLSMRQNDCLHDRLKAAGAVGLKHGWAISREELGLIAAKAGGVTPEYYLEWDGSKSAPGQRGSEEFTHSPKQQVAAADFLSEVSIRTGIELDALLIVWSAIVQVMPGWLLSCKSIDFGFLRLHALPYRQNWYQLLISRAPGLKQIYHLGSRRRILERTFGSVARLLRGCELTSARRTNQQVLLNWTVEVVPTTQWEKIVTDSERVTASRLGPLGYPRGWGSKVSQLEEVIHEVAAYKTKKEYEPTARLLWRRGQRGVRFAVGSPTILGVPTRMDCDEGGLESLDDLAPDAHKLRYLEAKAKELLAVPDLRQEKKDVRLSRGGCD
jgi:hypothetical protein